MPLSPGTRFGPYGIKSILTDQHVDNGGSLSPDERPVFLHDDKTLALVRGQLGRTEPAAPPRIRGVLGWDRELWRLGSQERPRP